MVPDKPERDPRVRPSVADKAIALYLLCELSASRGKLDETCSFTVRQQAHHLIFIRVPNCQDIQDLPNVALKIQSDRRTLLLKESSRQIPWASLHVASKLTTSLPNQ